MHFFVNGICSGFEFGSQRDAVWPCSSFIVLYFNLELKAVLVLESADQPPKGWAPWLSSVALSQPENTSLCLVGNCDSASCTSAV